MSGVVFDTGALIALDRGDRSVVALASEARRTKATVTVPAGCVAQAWRDPARQARLAAFLRQPNVAVVALDAEEARRIGVLLGRVKARDVVDAHVAICGHRLRQVVVTSDPGDIERLAPSVTTSRV